MTGDKLAAERLGFEKFWGDHTGSDKYLERDDKGEYYEAASRHAWIVWQAALRSAPDSPQKDSLRVGGLQWESVSASSASRLPEGGFAWRPTHRHVKRGSDYMVLGTGYIQTDEPLFDSDAVVIYRAEDGSLWARKYSEFKDGRFQPLPQEANPPPVQREARETLDEAAAPQPTVRKDGARSTSEGSEWRPIESAPSSLHILVWHKDGFATIAYVDCKPSDYGQWTHWMPLPPPPESKPAAGSDEAPPVVGVDEAQAESIKKEPVSRSLSGSSASQPSPCEVTHTCGGSDTEGAR